MPAFVDGPTIRERPGRLPPGHPCLPVLGREDQSHVLAERLVFGPAEDVLRAGVPDRDATFEVGGDNRVVGRALENGAQAPLCRRCGPRRAAGRGVRGQGFGFGLTHQAAQRFRDGSAGFKSTVALSRRPSIQQPLVSWIRRGLSNRGAVNHAFRRSRTITSMPVISMPCGACGRSPTVTPSPGMSTSTSSPSMKK